MLCDYGCGRIAKYYFKRVDKWCCSKHHQSCPVNSKKYSQPGNKNGMYGKPCIFKGKTKDNYKPLKVVSEKIKQHHEDGNIECYFLNYWKNKSLSDSHKSNIAKSMKGNNYGKGRGKITIYQNISFRSTWEAKVARYLDMCGISWLYEEKAYSLNETQSYRPDFFIYENNYLTKIIEVKGYFWKENIKKFEDFKQKYPNINIELWDKDILQNLNII
jgi:hypothetical protein